MSKLVVVEVDEVIIPTAAGKRTFIVIPRLKDAISAELKPLEQIPITKRAELAVLAEKDLQVLYVPTGFDHVNKHTTIGVVTDEGGVPVAVSVEFLVLVTDDENKSNSTERLVVEINSHLADLRTELKAA